MTTQHTAASLFAEFDRLDLWSRALADSTEENLEICDERREAVVKLALALPNTPDNLKLRARAIGSLVDDTDDLANLDLNELAAHAHGHAGELVRQVLACIMAAEGDDTASWPTRGHWGQRGLSGMLAGRDSLLRVYNRLVADEQSAAEASALLNAIVGIEQTILCGHIASRDDLLVKALLIVGAHASQLDGPAKEVFAEAKALGLIEYEA